MVDPTKSLQSAGRQDGDDLTAVAIEPKLAATDLAVASFCCGSDRVVTWGHPDCGRDSSEIQDQLNGVQQVQATGDGAFAAILADGLVVTWGDEEFGGDSSQVWGRLKGVQQVQATLQAFAAILVDGSVVTWGYAGGDSSRVQDQLKSVQQVQATRGAFAAMRLMSLVSWGSK